MTNFANTVSIKNFKSIRHLTLDDCRRINLFIGKPNVGKSNILEALSLFSLPYLAYSQIEVKDFIRFDNFNELFFDGDLEHDISIEINNEDTAFISNSLEQKIRLETEGITDNIYFDGKLSPNHEFIPVKENYPYKSYFFKKKHIPDNNFGTRLLLPPFGANLYSILLNKAVLKKEVTGLFENYGLHLVFDKTSQELKITKGIENGEMFLLPYSSIADSLQRLIFYKTAIASNKNSIITFEEPEAHTYPPYIKQIANDIIGSKTNQFFITTHSPYVVNELLASSDNGELAIFLVDFKDGETISRRLSDEELDTVYNDGIDLFFNNELFL